MCCVITGDLDGLLDLFDRGLASPHDCDVCGRTIFDVACIASHTDIVKHFIKMNLDTRNSTAIDIETVSGILQGTMPIDIIGQLSSRGCFETLANSAEEFELECETSKCTELECELSKCTEGLFVSGYCLLLASQRKELFELCLRTYFPFFQDLQPWARMWILLGGFGDKRWTADGLRYIICPNGLIRPIDTKAWNNRGISILHVVFSYNLMQFSEAEAGDFRTLLKEAIQATDDVHEGFVSEPYQHVAMIREHCGALQLGLMTSLHLNLDSTPSRTEQRTTRTVLEGLTMALQSLVSVLASCGYDLLEFGRREAVRWGDQRKAGSNVGSTLYLGFIYDEVREVRAVHYGAEPRDWYFEVDCHYEDYAGVFWNLTENPHLFMVPGAWVDEE